MSDGNDSVEETGSSAAVATATLRPWEPSEHRPLQELTVVPQRELKLDRKTIDLVPRVIIECIIRSAATARKTGECSGLEALTEVPDAVKTVCYDENFWKIQCDEQSRAQGDKLWKQRPSPVRTWFGHYMMAFCGVRASRTMQEILHAAIWQGNRKKVQAALAYGANPIDEDAPLRAAVEHEAVGGRFYMQAQGDMVGIVRLLLEYGPPSAYGLQRALYVCLSSRSKTELRLESRKVAQLLCNYIDHSPVVPLQWSRLKVPRVQACMKRVLLDLIRLDFRPEGVEFLVRRYPYLATTNYDPMNRPALSKWAVLPSSKMYASTPYYLALQRQPPDMLLCVKTLLKLGFSTEIPLNVFCEKDPPYYRFATVYAVLRGHGDVLRVLEAHGAALPALDEEWKSKLDAEIESAHRVLLSEVGGSEWHVQGSAPRRRPYYIKELQKLHVNFMQRL